ncbi:hypothetical protein DMENIID0001_042690 [Sergentomyia squamirostris]
MDFTALRNVLGGGTSRAGHGARRGGDSAGGVLAAKVGLSSRGVGAGPAVVAPSPPPPFIDSWRHNKVEIRSFCNTNVEFAARRTDGRGGGGPPTLATIE